MNIPDTLPDPVILLGRLTCPSATSELSDSDIRKALLAPYWPDQRTDTVFDVIRPGESVACVISDHTRKIAAHRVLPVLLKELTNRGCRLSDMCFLVASGIHRASTSNELKAILGETIFCEFAQRIHQHNPDDTNNLVNTGTMQGGHKVMLNRRAVETRRLVLLGGATYHYHAGFGGGRKLLVPGLAGRDTIAFTHSLTLDPHEDRIHPCARIGNLDGNPVSEAMLEAARFRQPDMTINTVLTPDGKLSGVYSGDMEGAHRAACRQVEQLCRVNIPEPADLVVASAGYAGNWIQSHKALFNASRAVRNNGFIVLSAPCPEGLGDERFRYWISHPDQRSIFDGLRKSPEVLGQTALSTKMRGRQTILVSKGLSADDLEHLGIPSAPDVTTAIHMALELLSARGISKPTAYIMPQADKIVPFIL